MEKSFDWNAPVNLPALMDLKQQWTITDTRDAAHYLTFDWPWRREETYDNALRACGLVLGGYIAPDAARSWLLRLIEETSTEMNTHSLIPTGSSDLHVAKAEYSRQTARRDGFGLKRLDGPSAPRAIYGTSCA